jgi:hypothetical protein
LQFLHQQKATVESPNQLHSVSERQPAIMSGERMISEAEVEAFLTKLKAAGG